MNTFTRREIIIIAVALAAIIGVWFFVQDTPRADNGMNGAVDEANKATTTETGGGSVTPPKTTSPAKTTPPVANTEPVSFATVTYTNTGFSPGTVTVKLTGAVRFINKSNQSMWIRGFAPTKETKLYPGLDQGKSVPKGGTFELNFGQVGAWWYQNLNNKSHSGIIIVIP